MQQLSLFFYLVFFQLHPLILDFFWKLDLILFFSIYFLWSSLSRIFIFIFYKIIIKLFFGGLVNLVF
jgi:hypothetical protein